MDDLDMRTVWASPRHAYQFQHSSSLLLLIMARRDELGSSGRVSGKQPIVNFQRDPPIVEMHDGNTSAVSWLLWAEAANIEPTFSAFSASFNNVIVLKNRRHSNGAVWHPFLLPELRSAPHLMPVYDREQRRSVCKAVTRSGRPVYFTDTSYFSDNDASLQLGDIARQVAQRL